jgi:hypothetical protein
VPINRLPPAEPDRVLCATRAYAAACGRVPPFGDAYGAAYVVACAAFRRAVRARLIREVAEGLPADVAGHLMLVAIRFAVTEPAYGPVAAHVEDAARELLDATARALRPIDPGEDE